MLFNYYDFDRDGCLNAVDLITLTDNLPKSGLIYKEAKYICDYYVRLTMTDKTSNRQP